MPFPARFSAAIDPPHPPREPVDGGAAPPAEAADSGPAAAAGSAATAPAEAPHGDAAAPAVQLAPASAAARTPAPLSARSAAHAAPPVTILVCTTCRGPDGADAAPTDGERLLAAVRSLAGGVHVEGTACLANCNRRLSAALIADGGWSYVFGSLTSEDAADLVAGANLLGEADGAPLPWRDRPACLKRGLVARIPPLPAGARR